MNIDCYSKRINDLRLLPWPANRAFRPVAVAKVDGWSFALMRNGSVRSNLFERRGIFPVTGWSRAKTAMKGLLLVGAVTQDEYDKVRHSIDDYDAACRKDSDMRDLARMLREILI